MAFDTIEQSRSLGEPITLLHVRYGEPEGAFYAYTDAEQAVVFEGVTYQPIPLDTDSVKASGTMDKTGFTIRMPKSTELAKLLLGFPPSQTVSVVLRQGHIGDSEFLVAQVARVLSGRREGDEFLMTCEPFVTSMRRPMIRRHYQLGCPHVLYGSDCRANKTAASVTRTLLGVSAGLLTLDSNWETTPRKPKYVGGQVAWTLTDGRVEVREILSTTDTTILIGYPGPELGSGSEVILTLGCNHQMSDCADLHNNIQNFGGCPWIPLKNPIGIVNNFY